MRLPNAAEAQADERKITRYLLNEDHSDNSGKAHFFRALGYESKRWQALVEALRTHAETHPVARTEASSYGMKYIIEGPFPSARLWVRAVWMIDDDDTAPRLVTAYPINSPHDP